MLLICLSGDNVSCIGTPKSLHQLSLLAPLRVCNSIRTCICSFPFPIYDTPFPPPHSFCISCLTAPCNSSVIHTLSTLCHLQLMAVWFIHHIIYIKKKEHYWCQHWPMQDSVPSLHLDFIPCQHLHLSSLVSNFPFISIDPVDPPIFLNHKFPMCVCVIYLVWSHAGPMITSHSFPGKSFFGLEWLISGYCWDLTHHTSPSPLLKVGE